jgi:hypothetical protein
MDASQIEVRSSLGRQIARLAGAVLATGLVLTIVSPQAAQACLRTPDPAGLAKTADRDYAAILIKRFGSKVDARLTALMKDIAPETTASVALLVSRCSGPARLMLNLSSELFGPDDDPARKVNFDLLWRGLQTKYADRLCASDGSPGVPYGTLMKITSVRRPLPAEIEFIAHGLNGQLSRSDGRGMRIEASADHPRNCAARGLEHGAKVAALDAVGAASPAR